jgi:L-arabinonolactonase
MTSSILKEILESPPPPFEHNGSCTAKRILNCQNTLGECIIYDDQQNKILWTDIYGKEFHILNLTNGSHRILKLPKMLCSFGLLDQYPTGGYLFGWEDGFQLYDPETNTALGNMSDGEDVNPHRAPTRLNDGRCDPMGKRFICGGYYGDIEGMYMKVYKVEMIQGGQLTHKAIIDKIEVTNSICWSPDGGTMYLADSPTQTIFKYDYDAKHGEISNKAIFRKLDIGVPDGSCNDSQGNVWNAVWRGGKGKSFVQCTNQHGKVIYTVELPDNTSQLTCCCFGGPNLDVLFISSASVGVDMKREPFAGSLYAVKLGVRGRRETRLSCI